MTASMTAFSRTERDLEDSQLIWEIRSVNHRYLDINLKLPDELKALDTACRKQIADSLNRGRIDAHLKFEKSGRLPGRASIDAKAVDALVTLLRQIEAAHPNLQPARSTDILHWPGVMPDSQIDTEILSQNALESLAQGLCELIENRQREGARPGVNCCGARYTMSSSR